MSDHFFVIGAQRSGTTYLYHVLSEHPMIEMASPIKPEPKFFLRSDITTLNEAHYTNLHFNPIREGAVRGEKSTTYIEAPGVPQRIRAWYPEAKIVVILREPVARAVSNYHFTANHGLEPLSVEEAFWKEDERRDQYDHAKISASPYAYLQRGRYIDYLLRWQEHFPREQIIVNIFEEFVGDLAQVQALYAALNVDASYVPEQLELPANSSDKVDLPAFSPELAEYLRGYFAESNAALEAWLGRSIPAWKALPR